MTIVAGTVLAVVFAAALVGKARPAGFVEFERSVGHLWPGRARPKPAVQHVLAVGLLGVEAVVGAALVVGTAAAVVVPWQAVVLPGLACAAVLLALFTAVQALAVARQVSANCACFGRSGTPVGPVSLARTALLLLVSAGGLLALLGVPVGVDRSGPVVVLSIVGVFAGAVVGLLLVHLEDVVALFWTIPARTSRLDDRP